MHVRDGTPVEARIGDCDHLVGALVVGAVDDDVRIEDWPGHIVREFHRRHFLDMAYFIDRREITEVALLHDKMHLVATDLQVLDVQPCRGGDLCLQIIRIRVDIVMQDYVHLT
jgi:hypothetical protein